MSPSIVNNNNEQVPSDADFDLQSWLKEIEGAENLMTEVEAKADNLQAKVDALLKEVTQPSPSIQDTAEKEHKKSD
ncbi:uncharacterized protein B0P05DRAFT_536989 [Gilbertella persicaria]|uniref:uncharacterized protein n=1 Tax=Gilbertella persicaria TaxID=101096 RepID=UPI0022204A16|nr:uncharacterized protein B0P05DRAFT_536989 [Gilbertella persicaria]KAI8083350.1 hypothetical protein B0P05DRAFT_536989 [Gilbertella persicaria]